MRKPVNRFNVRVTFDDGASAGIENRKDVTLTREDVLRCLEDFSLRCRFGYDASAIAAHRNIVDAAPDMLGALKAVAIIMNCGLLREFDGEPWIGRVKDAIAKAEGLAAPAAVREGP